jgi:Ca2+-binding RTX toxin-like protein
MSFNISRYKIQNNCQLDNATRIVERLTGKKVLTDIQKNILEEFSEAIDSYENETIPNGANYEI